MLTDKTLNQTSGKKKKEATNLLPIKIQLPFSSTCM